MDQKNVERIAQAVVARMKDECILRASFIDGDPNNAAEADQAEVDNA